MNTENRVVLMRNLFDFLLGIPVVGTLSFIYGFFGKLSPAEVSAIKVALFGVIGQIIVIIFRTIWEKYFIPGDSKRKRKNP